MGEGRKEVGENVLPTWERPLHWGQKIGEEATQSTVGEGTSKEYVTDPKMPCGEWRQTQTQAL